MNLPPKMLPNSPISRGKRIKYIRDNMLNISRRELCKNSNIGIATLKGWEAGVGGGVSKVGAEKLANWLKNFEINCSSTWILHGLGNQPTTDMQLQPTTEEKQIIQEILLFRKQDHSIDMLITDDSMTPSFYPGNYVAGIISKNLDICIEKTCIVITKSSDKLVRIINHGDEPGRYNLICKNFQTDIANPIMKNIAIIAAAPVLFTRRKNPGRNL